MTFENINFLAVLVSGIATMVVGSLWYSPLLFSKPWMKLVGIDENNKAQMDKMKKEAGLSMFGMFINILVSNLILELILNNLGIFDFGSAILASVLLWVGFSGSSSFNLFLFEKRPLKLFIINNGYTLIGMVLSAIILTVMK